MEAATGRWRGEARLDEPRREGMRTHASLRPFRRCRIAPRCACRRSTAARHGGVPTTRHGERFRPRRYAAEPRFRDPLAIFKARLLRAYTWREYGIASRQFRLIALLPRRLKVTVGGNCQRLLPYPDLVDRHLLRRTTNSQRTARPQHVFSQADARNGGAATLIAASIATVPAPTGKPLRDGSGRTIGLTRTPFLSQAGLAISPTGQRLSSLPTGRGRNRSRRQSEWDYVQPCGPVPRGAVAALCRESLRCRVRVVRRSSLAANHAAHGPSPCIRGSPLPHRLSAVRARESRRSPRLARRNLAARGRP